MRSRLSEHLRLEVAAAHIRGEPLELGEPVPGCGCESCTGLPDDHPARLPAWKQQNPDQAERVEQECRQEWERLVQDARGANVADVAACLGCGKPVKRGQELAVRCPLHEDSDPSCRLDVDAGLWYCDPCGEGGDAIRLWMRARGVGFAEAVRELAGAAR